MGGFSDLVNKVKDEAGAAKDLHGAYEKAKSGDMHGALDMIEKDWATMDGPVKRKVLEKINEAEAKYQQDGHQIPEDIKTRIEKLKTSM